MACFLVGAPRPEALGMCPLPGPYPSSTLVHTSYIGWSLCPLASIWWPLASNTCCVEGLITSNPSALGLSYWATVVPLQPSCSGVAIGLSPFLKLA
eukprot:5935787-Karenia_brevis.AAC.1